MPANPTTRPEATMTSTAPLVGVRADLINALIGDTVSASDALIKRLADTVRDCRDHDHNNGGAEDLYCGNLFGWAGERMAPVLHRLLGAEAEVERLRAELADTAMMRDFNQRSAEHIAAKRDLAEAAIAAWDRDEISGDAAVLMIRKALADGSAPAVTPACSCHAERVHQAGCPATT